MYYVSNVLVVLSFLQLTLGHGVWDFLMGRWTTSTLEPIMLYIVPGEISILNTEKEPMFIHQLQHFIDREGKIQSYTPLLTNIEIPPKTCCENFHFVYELGLDGGRDMWCVTLQYKDVNYITEKNFYCDLINVHKEYVHTRISIKNKTFTMYRSYADECVANLEKYEEI